MTEARRNKVPEKRVWPFTSVIPTVADEYREVRGRLRE